MFIWKTSVVLKQFETKMADLYRDMVTLEEEKVTVEALDKFYTNCLKESIDFGIMEQADSVSAVEGVFQWDDIGSWESLTRINASDDKNNTVVGDKVYLSESSNTIVANQSNHTVAVIGAEDMLVVTVEDTTMVIHRDKLPEIKKYITEIKSDNKFPENLF